LNDWQQVMAACESPGLKAKSALGKLDAVISPTFRHLATALSLALLGMACDARADSADTASSLNDVFLVNLAGEKVPALRPSDAAATVFLFLNAECPISNRYAPELRRLNASLKPRRVAFRIVYPGEDASVKDIRRHVREFELPGEPLRDPRLALARATGASVTPEAVVILPDGRMAYRGRIDDQFPDLNAKRPAPTRRDLEEALNEILSGKPVSRPRTKAVGCAIQGPP